jgi:hypothetical protein
LRNAASRRTTGGDGTFEIEGLAPGRHVLDVTRTLGGDLVTTALPFGVGDDGGATVVGELAWGSTRVRSTYVRGGRDGEDIVGPSGALGRRRAAAGSAAAAGRGRRVGADLRPGRRDRRPDRVRRGRRIRRR